MGDLISRETAVAILRAKADMTIGEVKDAASFFNHCANMIEKLPAVDAEPVRHGKCEFCSRGKPIKAFTILRDCGLQYGTSIMANYCPLCGAKIDGGDEK